MSVIKKMQEAFSQNTTRRGFLRSIVRLSASVAAICAGMPVSATGQLACWEDVARSNGGAGDTCGTTAYCENNSSSWGCTIGSGFPRACTIDDGCTGTTGSVSSSNCGGYLISTGWWDCCCDGTKTRCRDCSQGGQIVCICRANIGTC